MRIAFFPRCQRPGGDAPTRNRDDPPAVRRASLDTETASATGDAGMGDFGVGSADDFGDAGDAESSFEAFPFEITVSGAEARSPAAVGSGTTSSATARRACASAPADEYR
jgi:hypothetical protein